MSHNGHKTAIARKGLSAPMRWLQQSGRLQGRCLDYGCGRGSDADTLGIDGFDPTHRPVRINGLYNTVCCHFVLNVIPTAEERTAVIDSIRSLLAPGGVAYISVRADTANLKGWTSRGTWQGDIHLPEDQLIHKTSSYRLYMVTA